MSPDNQHTEFFDMGRLKSVWFVGAGGIGMAALERYFLSRGLAVGGYDRTETELVRTLRAEGIGITLDDSAEAIPAQFRDPATTLVVYTPAVPDSHPGLAWLRANGFTVMKRAAVLGMITRHTKAICFAGTHGKTTTSCMAAHLLEVSGIGCNAFLGGILRNYGSNLLLSEDSPWSVVEADEYDRSFHHLRPTVAVITSTDPDHLDIYGTEEAYLESFARFTELIAEGGALVVHTGLKLRPRPRKGVRTLTYSLHEGDYHAANIRMGDGRIVFDLIGPGGAALVSDIELGVPVKVNIENAVAAMAALDAEGLLEPGSCRRAMASFQGPSRRFEFHVKEPGRAIIDDYAHHPDELRASIESVRALYPGRKLTVAFQPHLYSRTRDFAPEFAEALSGADDVVLIDIYPAREEPIPGVTSKIILDRVTSPRKTLVAKRDLPATLRERGFEILLTAGAGDICDLLPEITANSL